MKTMYYTGLWALLFTALSSCNGQIKSNNQTETKPSTGKSRLVGGGCDGCDLMYVAMPSVFSSTDTAIDWTEKGQKLLVTGKVYQPGGKKPAADVIVYYYHTDNTGHYSKRNDKPGNQTAHGYIRGWVKTGTDGHYSIYTTRPVAYPKSDIPAHIHIVIKEPGLNEYYIDELVFDDDTLLTKTKRQALENRGGNGILKVVEAGVLQVAEHNIILGLHIPNYPGNIEKEKQ